MHQIARVSLQIKTPLPRSVLGFPKELVVVGFALSSLTQVTSQYDSATFGFSLHHFINGLLTLHSSTLSFETFSVMLWPLVSSVIL